MSHANSLPTRPMLPVRTTPTITSGEPFTAKIPVGAGQQTSLRLAAESVEPARLRVGLALPPGISVPSQSVDVASGTRTFILRNNGASDASVDVTVGVPTRSQVEVRAYHHDSSEF